MLFCITNMMISKNEKIKKDEPNYSDLEEINNLFKSQKIEIAENKAKELIKKYPNSFNLNFMIGVLCGTKKKLGEAVTYFYKAIENKPDHFDTLFRLGITLNMFDSCLLYTSPRPRDVEDCRIT